MGANAALREMKAQGHAVGRRQDALATARSIIGSGGQRGAGVSGAVAASKSKQTAGRVGGRSSAFIRGSKVAKTLPKEQRRALTGVIRGQEKRIRDEAKESERLQQAMIEDLVAERDARIVGLRGESRRKLRYEIWQRMQAIYDGEEYEELTAEDLISPADLEHLNELYTSPTLDDTETRAAAVSELYDYLHGFDEDYD